MNDVIFQGFTKDIFSFFSELEKNNNTKWFDKNRDRYQNNIVKPTKEFIAAIAPFINRLNPSIRTEPKFNETIMRINKDLRFAKGQPYRNYWLIHFGRFKMDSEFFLYFDAESVDIGLFINKTKGENLFFRDNLKKYSDKIIETFSQNSIDNKYSLYSLDDKEPKLIKKKFNAKNDSYLLENLKMLLLQKPVSRKIISSDKIILEMIKIINELYPIYCFCISPNPLKELERFENEFGEIVD